MPAEDSAVDPAALELFEMKVRPVLAENCYGCHGPEKQKSGLRLDSLESMLEGGESGVVLVPGDPAKSRMVLAVSYTDPDLRMPPKKKLADRQIEDIRAWVKLGAPWPGAGSGPGGGKAQSAKPAKRAFQITAEDRAYWAFQPVKSPGSPAVKRSDWVASPIDAFILAKLEEKGIEPNPPASPRELIRRAYFDLVGLPPPPENVDAFVSDPSPAAWEKLIDRLLARPEYGERWGRHWLDVVRFAESNGYERDDEKPFSWRYRDYVIQSFNADKPYDRFILEQLAGDEIDVVTPSSIVATGFYRLGVWDDEPDDARMAEFDYLDDILRTTGGAFLGLTVGCARCHDHKFDPIRQEDYYSLLSFFRNVRHHEHPKFDLDSATFAPVAAPSEVARWKSEWDRKSKDLEVRIAMCAAAPEKAKLEEQLKSVKAEKPPFEWALAVREYGAEPRKTAVLIRGSASSPGKEVEPAFLEVLGGERPAFETPIPGATTTGRRRALASWIASSRNPLTSRVIANRVWQHHFGRAIVETPNDFGKAGLAPTHPELLDWLAASLTGDGWSLKRLHKRILMSNAYRMSSSTRNAAALAADEGNRLLWRQSLRRLEAEGIRDTILSVSGGLNTRMGGRGIFPRLSREVIAGGSRPGLGWDVSSDEDRLRRSVYIFVKRTMLVPFLEGFDYANTAYPLDVRPVTTVAPQALMLLNSGFVDDQCSAFATRLLREAGDEPRAQVERAYRLAAGRKPSDGEIRIACDYLKRQESSFAALKPSLTFTPQVPSSVSGDYLGRLKPEDFLAGPRAGWSYHKGRWGNGYEGIDSVDPERVPFAFWEREEMSDLLVEGRLRLHPASELAALIFRAKAEGAEYRGYELLLDPRGGRVALRRHDAKEVRTLAEVRAAVVAEKWHDVRLEATGARLRVWLDGSAAPLLDATDASPILEPGRIGLKAWGSPLSVEDLVVRSGDKVCQVVKSSLGPESSPRRRALESFCRVVFNLNELVYVD